MLNLDAIKPQEGVLPPRPASLRHPTDLQATQTDVAVVEILEAGKAVVCGGLSLIGEEGYMVYVISLLQMKDENLHGWFLALGHPDKEEPDFEFIDTTVTPLTELPFPNCMTYFVGEVDVNILKADALPEDLEGIARFVISFISDEGPPKGIDW